MVCLVSSPLTGWSEINIFYYYLLTSEQNWGDLDFLTGNPHPEESENGILVNFIKLNTLKRKIPPKSALTRHLLYIV